ncbi:hypothetical protein PIB30_091775 [Stylosanthes scabra]|uniref:Uncharacterized protein n=1 Tax=Stylosanthes scabra TaxID=79078 RepID=A0ABU6VWI0_9FABA|nr:hypothetical protein [Stylosanthes scabra]
MGGTPVVGDPVEPKQSEEKFPNPQSPQAKKRKGVPREVTEGFGTSVNALEKGFINPVPFVDQYLMTQEAEEALEGIEVMDSTIQKENRIKTLDSGVTELEAKEKSRGAEVLRLEGVEKRLNEKV